MRAAKTKAGGGSGIHRLQVAKVKGTIRPNPAGHSEPGEKTSARGMDYGTHVQETRMDGWAPSENRLGHKRGGACKAKGGEATIREKNHEIKNETGLARPRTGKQSRITEF